MIGRKGSEDWLKEWPAHRTIPLKGGKTSVD